MTTRQMFIIMLGALVGMLIGAAALLWVFRMWGEHIQDNGLYVLLTVGTLVIGGLTGGAYLTQWVLFRIDKARKRSKKDRKKNKRRR